MYHYWFEITDDRPDRNGSRTPITDPTARTVDWRLVAPRLPPPYDADDRDPAGVVKYQGGNLVPCDPGGEEPNWSGDASPASLPPNNRLVIYEMPTSWSRDDDRGGVEIDVGSFRDVHALVDPAAPLGNFEDLEAVRGTIGRLGVNALELLPPADSWR